MVDKPGRRKKRVVPWAKLVAVALVVLVAGAVAWEVYWNYIYEVPPAYVEIGTSQGDIYVQLFTNCAPKTVANFENLSATGFYDNLVFHRIVPGFVIQTGDPNTRGAVNSTRPTWGQGGSPQTVPLEVSRCPALTNAAGYVAMAREGNTTYGFNTGSSQFYIVLDNQTQPTLSQLDGYYTIFGKVISGMNVVCAIANKNVDPTYGSSVPSTSYLVSQPIYPQRAMMYNVTVIPASEAPAPVPIKQC